MLLLTSCVSDSLIEFYPEFIKYNIYRSDSEKQFSFNINVTSTDDNLELKFLSATGVNVDNLNISFTDDTFESISGERICNKYVFLVGVHCTNISEYTQINSIKVLANGSEYELVFDEPIKNYRYDYSDTEHILTQLSMPIYVFPQSFADKNATDYSFVVEAIEDTVVTSFGFNDYVSFCEEKVYVNDNLIGSLAETLPVELKAGDVLKVKGYLKSNDSKLTGYENLYLNTIIECQKNQQTITEYYPLTATFIGNITDAEDFIAYTLK